MKDTSNPQDHFKLLFEYISSFGKVSCAEIERIKENTTLQIVKKREVLVKENEACNKLFFVNSGLIRSFYRNTNGQIVTRMLAAKNTFIGNMNGINGQFDNTETIECLENSEILVMNRINFSKILDEFPNLKGIYSEILEVYDVMNIKRFHLMSLESVPAKIKFFKDEYPHLIDKLSDSIFASFLGISRETIVRHKKNYINHKIMTCVTSIL